ncbi:MAG: hypothetical protein PHR77_08370 [Kiritimatiellae bacterium]|nr:hypothetical protein [Kiritimatiellia bacterium]
MAYYLRLSVFPYPLCLDYSWQPSTEVFVLLPWILLIGVLFVGSIISAFGKLPAGFLGLSFFAILSPTSSVIPVADLAVEHRMYLPLIALIVFFVVGSYNLTEYLASRFKIIIRGVWLCIYCGLLIIFLFLTLIRNTDYYSEEAVWRDVVRKRPHNLRARNDLAVALSEAGKVEEAIEEYNKVLASIPGDVLKRLREGAVVIMDIFITNSFEYQYFRANVNKAVLMTNQNNGDNEAIRLYTDALKVAPFNANVIERLKSILRRKNIPESRLDYEIHCLLTSAKKQYLK